MIVRYFAIVALATGLAGGAAQAQTSTPAPVSISAPLAQPLAPTMPQAAAPVLSAPVLSLEPDIGDLFRAEVSAVVGSGSARRVLLGHGEDYGRSVRSLKVGDVYQDGWKIATISPKAVGLVRSGETRLVDLTAPAKAAVAANTAAIEASQKPAVVNLGNLGMPTPPPEPADSADPAVDPATAASAPGVTQGKAASALGLALLLLNSQAQ